MNILALETSVPHASLCLYKDGEFCCQADWQALRNHDAYLFPALQQAMDMLDGAPLDLVLVGAGPGSYGGVRVALAAGVGISMVRKCPLVAVPSWDQLAKDGTCIVSDARRGGWTLRRPDGSITVITPQELRNLLDGGARVYTVEDEPTMRKAGMHAARYGLCPTARGVVETWLTLDAAARAELTAKPAEPIYVRPPHITEAHRKPWETAR